MKPDCTASSRCILGNISCFRFQWNVTYFHWRTARRLLGLIHSNNLQITCSLETFNIRFIPTLSHENPGAYCLCKFLSFHLFWLESKYSLIKLQKRIPIISMSYSLWFVFWISFCWVTPTLTWHLPCNGRVLNLFCMVIIAVNVFFLIIIHVHANAFIYHT